MNLFYSYGTNKETYVFDNAICFNVLRNAYFRENYKKYNRIGYYDYTTHETTDSRHAFVTDNVANLKKALKWIPLLSCVRYEVFEGEHDKIYHIISVSTRNIPADQAMQAMFIARSFLDGTFYQTLTNCFTKFDVKKLENKKYFVALLFLFLAFNPRKQFIMNSEGFFDYNGEQFVKFNLYSLARDGYTFTASGTSLYSVLKFYYGGYTFAQKSLHSQKGYIRDSVMWSDTDHTYTFNCKAKMYRKAAAFQRVACKPTFFSEPKAPVTKYLSNLMAQGEIRKNFIPKSEFCVENFFTYLENHKDHYITEENFYALIDHVVGLIKKHKP